MKHWRLALRLLWRDSRSGELSLLAIALLIAVNASTTISLFADRLQRTMTLQAAEFMGGDLVLTSPTAIGPAWLQQAEQRGLARAETVEFGSVLLEHKQMLLAAAKAVSSAYPLRGVLKTRVGEEAEDQVKQGPEPGEAWVEPRVLSALSLKIGDSLTLGEQPLKIARILVYESDKGSDFYSFSPRVMFNQADLAATGVVQPGSRVQYSYQFIGDEPALAQFKDWLKPQLTPSQRMLDIHQDRPELGSALRRAERYLGLSSVVVILIAGVAIAMATGRYSERHFDAAALLRCFGSSQAEILRLYSLQFICLGLLVSGLGCGLGWLGQYGLFVLLAGLLPGQLALPSVWAVLMGFASGLLILWGFALPPLLRLRKVAPLRVLRRELAPLPAAAWLVYGSALILVAALIWRYSNDAMMTASILGVSLLVLSVLAGVVYGLLRALRGLLPRLGLSWRMALQSLTRDSRASVAQIMAFSMTLAAMLLSFSVRTDLIQHWQQQLPEHAPNHFILNILPDLQQAFASDVQQAGINSSPFYPVVRGRLVMVNQQPVQKRVSKDSQGDNATQRELSLTWVQQIGNDTPITAGGSWPDNQAGWVSVEQKLAENLSIQVGDQLQFTIGSAQVNATVSSLRSVQWDSLKPNFYMMFSPGTLDSFPTTYMTSFYLAAEQKTWLNSLLKKYPATTVLEVDQLVQQFKSLLQQVSAAINYLLYFALLAGFSVLFAAVYASLDTRIYQGVLMRTLGASRGLLRRIQWLEFSLLGGVSGVLAVIVAEAIRVVVYQKLMQMDYVPNIYYWLALPLIGIVSVGIAGFIGVRQVLNESPMRVLRRD